MIKIKVLENTYEANYPTVGQCIDIKKLEIALSGNRINTLIVSENREDNEIALDCKAIAIMSVLFPKLKGDLKVESFLDLRYDDWLEILNVFSSEVFPWYTTWKDSIRKLNLEEVDTKKSPEDVEDLNS